MVLLKIFAYCGIVVKRYNTNETIVITTPAYIRVYPEYLFAGYHIFSSERVFLVRKP